MFKRKLIEILKDVINSLEDDKRELQEQLKEKEHNNIILLENAMELRERIKDLENNIELLYYDRELKEDKK